MKQKDLSRLNLENNDYISEIIVYVEKNKQSFFCYSDKTEWIVESWFGHIYPFQGTLEDTYFEYIKQFKVSTEELKSAYQTVHLSQDLYQIYGNLPSIYIDFDQKLFLSRYYDQALESRMIEGWTGKYQTFFDLIPEEDRYWIVGGKDYSEGVTT
jgi:hypothetical protein